MGEDWELQEGVGVKPVKFCGVGTDIHKVPLPAGHLIPEEESPVGTKPPLEGLSPRQDPREPQEKQKRVRMLNSG